MLTSTGYPHFPATSIEIFQDFPTSQLFHLPVKRIALSHLLIALYLVCAGLLGWWMVKDAAISTGTTTNQEATRKPAPARVVDTENADSKGGPRSPSRMRLSLEDALLGIPNERLVRFSNDADYLRFLASLDGSGLRLLGQIDQLRTVRLGFDELSDFDDLLDDADTSTNYLVSVPDLPDVSAQPGALGFGNQLLAWLGINEDNSSWGTGIKIAILDTGIGAHSALPDGIRQVDLVSTAGEIPINGHGTAVASLIVGKSGLARGIAPGAEITSFRIGNENGESNSFLLAEGIIAAADAGSQLLNISMGSYGDSAIVRDAISYAQEQGALIIASSGNEGFDAPAYPASYDGVISVGAVDAKSDFMNFSNFGSTLDAPGYSINAAWTEDQYTLFSGTSASAPVVTAAIAATATQLNIPLDQAYDVVFANLNEAGAPGNDPSFGEGIVHVGRAVKSTTPGLYDVAAASNHYVPANEEDPIGSLFVTFQNRGTESIINYPATITLPNNTYSYNIANLPPGGIQTFDVPLYIPRDVETFGIISSVEPNEDQSDVDPRNNSLGTQISLTPSDPRNPSNSRNP